MKNIMNFKKISERANERVKPNTHGFQMNQTHHCFVEEQTQIHFYFNHTQHELRSSGKTKIQCITTRNIRKNVRQQARTEKMRAD